MLQTLLLNEWCVVADIGALVCFLRHTPVLEKLTIQLPRYKTNHRAIEVYESYNPTEQFIVLDHLKVVEIKCYKEDELVHKIIQILSTFGVIPSEQIGIHVIPWDIETLWFTESFSFEQQNEDPGF